MWIQICLFIKTFGGECINKMPEYKRYIESKDYEKWKERNGLK